ncbi:hypothetical protein [Aneurinibacillus aneurinilyticus]|jgi:hypothetical protein|uniref:Uncharacterized protein n=2 Tax=Aneurinibacillus aneurinilyticus TaxID=1391 RepID=A0A848D1B6_ANEAE|nr:hypothetical protein [Aneurinibacillus aneurinilyticus]ERI11327.1 hypothetical protein HMPREF0083_00545 [Aneurinibacillus aneurinilyticus ATCC 12856]MED0708661.1 hypothetical protein [Aneurinibacillus aneurinilyticus]MED0723133.1 hypothetical protein [Aneurinibacillus aneurinilyticus]MED0732330.1 hypothetical protein [Aneurinibacillus aneurinilyticus]MED0743504.1 hypothetical protein [Aneurinibacillus aneurinilyticus]
MKMKTIFFVLMQLFGCYVLFNAYEVLSIYFSDSRGVGVGITKLNILISVQDGPLLFYGTLFLIVGLLLIFFPFFLRKLKCN